MEKHSKVMKEKNTFLHLDRLNKGKLCFNKLHRNLLISLTLKSIKTHKLNSLANNISIVMLEAKKAQCLRKTLKSFIPQKFLLINQLKLKSKILKILAHLSQSLF